MANDQTLGLPQLAFVALLSGLAIKYFFFTPAASDDATTSLSSSGPRSRTHPNPVRDADVERVLQMFPQLQRRHVMWDLHLNGGSVAATTERVLSGRGLAVPPVTYQPATASSSTANAASAGSGTTSSAQARASTSKNAKTQNDLITRYNLQDKVATSEDSHGADRTTPSASSSSTDAAVTSASSTAAQHKTSPAWSQNKNERHALLQRRREEMILQARRKMEAKLTEEVKGATAS